MDRLSPSFQLQCRSKEKKRIKRIKNKLFLCKSGFAVVLFMLQHTWLIPKRALIKQLGPREEAHSDVVLCGFGNGNAMLSTSYVCVCVCVCAEILRGAEQLWEGPDCSRQTHYEAVHPAAYQKRGTAQPAMCVWSSAECVQYVWCVVQLMPTYAWCFMTHRGEELTWLMWIIMIGRSWVQSPVLQGATAGLLSKAPING